MHRFVIACLLGCSSVSAAPAQPDVEAPCDCAIELPVEPTLSWTPCNTSFECATFEPEEGTQLPVIRRRATSARIGAIVFNPGGPGNGVVADFPRMMKAFETLFGADVVARFDFIGID